MIVRLLILLLFSYPSGTFNRIISMARDMNGDGVIDAGDIATSYQYNQVGSKTRATSPLGGISTMSYDSLQRVVSMTTSPDNVLQYTTTFAYGANCGGNVFDSSCFKPTHTVDPRGYTSDVVYDALYRPVSTASVYNNNAAPAMTSQQYDPVGNVQVSTDALGRSTEVFTAYVEHILLPTLRPGDIVILDNLFFHKNVQTKALIEQAGAQIRFLPAYSPDFNPIEKMWSKIKSILRSLKARTRETLQHAIAYALRCVTPQDAFHWFASCGYTIN